MTPTWVADYIGEPYDALCWNCWTLVREIADRHLGMALPAFDRIEAGARPEVAKTIATESDRWQTVLTRDEIIAGMKGEVLGDVAVIRYGTYASHVGLVIAPSLMLHVDEGNPTHIANIRSAVWKRRIEGIFRRCH